MPAGFFFTSTKLVKNVLSREFGVRGRRCFTRVKMKDEEEIHRGVYASVVQSGKGNKGKNVYAVRRSGTP